MVTSKKDDKNGVGTRGSSLNNPCLKETHFSSSGQPLRTQQEQEDMMRQFFSQRISAVCGQKWSDPLSVKELYTVGQAVAACFEHEGIKILHAYRMDEAKFGEFKKLLLDKSVEWTRLERNAAISLLNDPALRAGY